MNLNFKKIFFSGLVLNVFLSCCLCLFVLVLFSLSSERENKPKTYYIGELATVEFVPSPTPIYYPPVLQFHQIVYTHTPSPILTLTPTNYLTPECVCNVDTYNCDERVNSHIANICYRQCFDAGFGDIHNLDGDDDGIPCE